MKPKLMKTKGEKVIVSFEHCSTERLPGEFKHHLRLRIQGCAPACETSGGSLAEVTSAFEKKVRKYLLGTSIEQIKLIDVKPWYPHDKITSATRLAHLRFAQRAKGREWSLFTPTLCNAAYA
jgi:hypothetical protein